jgi:Anti-sigma-K factor rskA
MVDSFPDSSEDVLNDLDPLSRALLDLSIQRGMDDAEIAQVLGADEDSVFEVRVGLLRNLAEQVAPEHAEDDLPELQVAVAERLYPEDETVVEADDVGDEAEPGETPVEAEHEDVPEPTPPPAKPAAPSRRRSWLPIVLPILLLLAVVALIVVARAGGESDDNSGKATTPPRAKQSVAESERKPTRLTALGSGDATGTATVEGNELTMTLRSPPDGTYTVWLYNSVIDAERIGVVKNGKVVAKLPENADKYRYVDVSREPNDGNANHSGQSVVRVPLRKLQS